MYNGGTVESAEIRMRQAIRQNPLIAAAVLLPLVIVFFFILASAVPRLLVDPPRYDFVFTVPESRSTLPNMELRFDVKDGRIRARVYGTNSPYGMIPKLFIFDHGTEAVREIPIDLPGSNEELEDGTEIELPQLAGRVVSTSRKAPDGYEIQEPRYGNDNLMNMLFGSSRRYRLSIEKSGAVLEIPTPGGNAYYYHNVSFLGWLTD